MKKDKMKEKYIFLAILFITLFHIISYSQNEEEAIVSTMKEYYKLDSMLKPLHYPTFYKRDSLFITFTLGNGIENGIDFTSLGAISEKFYNPKSSEKAHIIIDTIVYSPDSLKFVSIVLIKYKGKLIDEPPPIHVEDEGFYRNLLEDTLYDGYAFIGFRERLCETWKIYDFTWIHPFAYSNPIEAKALMRLFYFKKLKDFSDTVPIDPNDMADFPKKKDVKYDYNFQDRDFWDKSPVWQKGLRIEGYYNFQTRGNISKRSIDPILPYFEVKYPQYLLDFFPQCR